MEQNKFNKEAKVLMNKIKNKDKKKKTIKKDTEKG
jgi:hypothetical protein